MMIGKIFVMGWKIYELLGKVLLNRKIIVLIWD